MTKNVTSILQQAAEALKTDRYAEAEALQRQACEILREQGTEGSQLAAELETLADIHCTQRKFQAAANEYAEVVQLREKLVPENDYSILRPLYRLAKSHFEDQKYESAEAEMRRALALAETRTDSPESVAFCLYELAWLLYYVGKYREAEPYFIKALPISETTNGAAHPQTVRVLAGIALLYSNCHELGKHPEPYFRKVIDTTKADKDSRETYLTNLCRLASYLAEHKRLEEADELFSQLVKLVGDSGAASDFDNNWIISRCIKHFQFRGKPELVAQLLPEKQDYNAYGDIVQKRLEHAMQTLSQNDPEFAEALQAAGNHAIFEGKYQEAEPLLARALDACLKIYGENSSQTLLALNRVCIIKRLLGKFDEAGDALQRAVDGARAHFSDHGFYPWTLENVALLREAEGKQDDAESNYADAVAEYEKICGVTSYETAEALYHQSGCLLRMGKLASAEAAIRRAISVMDSVKDLSDAEKSDYLATLASILEATGRSAEASEMRDRGERLFEQAKQQSETDE